MGEGGTHRGRRAHLVLRQSGERLEVVARQVLAILLVQIRRGRVHGLHPAGAPAAPRTGQRRGPGAPAGALAAAPGRPRPSRGPCARLRAPLGLGLGLGLGLRAPLRLRLRLRAPLRLRLRLRLRAPGRHGNAPAPNPRGPALGVPPARLPQCHPSGGPGCLAGPGVLALATPCSLWRAPGAAGSWGLCPSGTLAAFRRLHGAGGLCAAGTVPGGAPCVAGVLSDATAGCCPGVRPPGPPEVEGVARCYEGSGWVADPPLGLFGPSPAAQGRGCRSLRRGWRLQRRAVGGGGAERGERGQETRRGPA